MTATDGSPAEDSTNKLTQKVSSYRLVFLSLVAMTPGLSSGSVLTFTSIALSQMTLNLEETSWFGSIPWIAFPVGNLTVWFLMDKYGRRISMLASISTCFVGWFLLADRKASLTQLYVGRSLTGFAYGAATLPPIVYAAECVAINDVRIRTSLGTLMTLSTVTSTLLSFILSVLLPYDQIALTFALVSALSFSSILIFIPESPAWLYRAGRIGDAEIAQQRLGIKQPILASHETAVPTANPTAGVNGKLDIDFAHNLMHYWNKIGRREVYTPLMITTAFIFFCIFSGTIALASYLIDLLTVYPMKIDPYVLSVVASSIQIIGCVSLTFILPYSGVRAQSIAAYLGASIAYFVLAFSMLYENPLSANIFNYLHIVSVIAILLASSMGLVAIPYAILGEFFPMGVKGYANIPLLAKSAFSFALLKIFPYTLVQYRNIVFFVFGGLCACGAVFVAICLPETVGKTTDEINDSFKKSVVKC